MATIKDLLATAEAELGYLEKKTNSNLYSKTGNAGDNNFTKYSNDMDNVKGWFNGKKNGYAWCSCFVSWCFWKTFGESEAKRLLCLPANSLAASCDWAAKYFKNKGQFFTSPQVGDQIFFKSKSYNYAHTGLVVCVENGKVITIEGNTSGASGVIDNGGGVCSKSYSLSYANIVGYGRPAWTDAEKSGITTTTTKGGITVNVSTLKKGSTGSQVNALQALLNGYGYSCGELDGDFGAKTYSALCNYQREHGLDADGSCGPLTWKSLLGV